MDLTGNNSFSDLISDQNKSSQFDFTDKDFSVYFEMRTSQVKTEKC